ncbi:hypothetical protein HPP92_028265, partial [Vanilla planifolia]
MGLPLHYSRKDAFHLFGIMPQRMGQQRTSGWGNSGPVDRNLEEGRQQLGKFWTGGPVRA